LSSLFNYGWNKRSAVGRIGLCDAELLPIVRLPTAKDVNAYGCRPYDIRLKVFGLLLEDDVNGVLVVV
jgi:hypothetical protein